MIMLNSKLTHISWCLVEWELLGRSAAELNTTKPLVVVKFVHKEWKTGHRLYQYHTTGPGCPHCGEYEDIEHICTCPSLAATQGITSTVAAMSRNLTGTKKGSEWTAVYQLILLYMTMGSIPPLPIATKYEGGLKEHILIGTLNFVQGKISRRLTRDSCDKSCPTKKSASFFEARLTIKSIWFAASQIWRARNNTKHGKTVAEQLNMQKVALDIDIATVLRSLHRKRIYTHFYPGETPTPSQPKTRG
jgi:ribosomal protein L32